MGRITRVSVLRPQIQKGLFGPICPTSSPSELRIQLLELRPHVSPGLSVAPGWREAEGGPGAGAPGDAAEASALPAASSGASQAHLYVFLWKLLPRLRWQA